MTIFIFFVYAFNRNKNAKLYLPSAFQISDKLKLNIHLTKSPKRDHIYKLCLYTLEEHKSLILTSFYVPKLKYRTHAQKNNHYYTSDNHLSITILKHLVYRWQMNLTAKF